MNQSFDLIKKVTALVESSNRLNAIRFEPLIMAQKHEPTIIYRIMRVHECSEDTASMIYSTSYGLYQIMGFNLYGKSVFPEITDHSFIAFLSDEVEQDRMLQYFLNSIGFPDGPNFDDPESIHEYATRYNGTGDVDDYVTAMKKALVRLAIIGGVKLNKPTTIS